MEDPICLNVQVPRGDVPEVGECFMLFSYFFFFFSGHIVYLEG